MMNPDVVVDASGREAPLAWSALFGWPEGVTRPVELEIGSGKGRFLLDAARQWPDRDFVAIEIAGSLVRKVRDRVTRAELPNVRLVHGVARDVFERLLPAASLSRVHVYFPDPWPKRRHARNRLFAGDFPDLVARALRPGGELLLATDSDPYFREAVTRLLQQGAFVRTLPDPFREIPPGGFDAIFAREHIPAFRGVWQLDERAGSR